MKFTIENFRSSVYRPGEYLFNNDKVIHCYQDLNKQFEDIFQFHSVVLTDGNTTMICVSKPDHGSEFDSHPVVTVEFLEDKVVICDTGLGNLRFEKKDDDLLPIKAPYWTCVKIVQKLVSCITKAVIEMNEFPDTDTNLSQITSVKIKQ